MPLHPYAVHNPAPTRARALAPPLRRIVRPAFRFDVQFDVLVSAEVDGDLITERDPRKI
jgi:hypothetical protein